MKVSKTARHSLFFWLSFAVLVLPAWADEKLPHADTYTPHPSEASKILPAMDDPRDKMVALPLKKRVPPEIWECLIIDEEKSKTLTAELVGFRSPDLVSKIAPEIKPGKYTYRDLDQYPGLRDLFAPEMLIRIKPGGPPLICNISEFEIIPTRQLYWYTRLCETTKRNLGKSQLDEKGYIAPSSWEGGYPFPQPSGKFRAQQIYYNFEKRSGTLDICYALRSEAFAFDRNLKIDKYGQFAANFFKLMGRTLFPPYGFFDQRARKNSEFTTFSTVLYEPRSQRGMVVLQ